MSPRLLLHVVSVEARARMSYRADFWIHAIVGFLAQFGVYFFLWQAVFHGAGGGRIGGYDLDGILLYYVAAILFARVVRGPEFQGTVSQDIYEGGLNRYLVFPTRYFAFKYAQNLGGLLPALLQLVLLGAWFPLLLDIPPEMGLTLPRVLMAVGALAAANLLYFAMSFSIQAVAFWADNVWSLTVAQRLVTGLLGGAMLPLAVFPAGARAVLEWLPFRFLFDFPVRTLLGQVGAGAWLEGLVLTLLWCGAFGVVARAVWRRGDLRYSGVGI